MQFNGSWICLHNHEDLSLSSDLTHASSSFPASPLSPSITPSHFHSRLKTHLLHLSFSSCSSTFPPTGLTPRGADSSCFSFFSGMSVLTLALCARYAGYSQLLSRRCWLVVTVDLQLECLRMWKVNDTRYLIARVVGDQSALANCFVRTVPRTVPYCRYRGSVTG